MSEQARELPFNSDAEQAILGSIIAANASFDRVAGFLREEHFGHPVHGRIFAACKRMIESGNVANHVSLKLVFDQDEDLKSIGGAAYLARLAGSVPTVASAESYGRMVLECWQRRCLIGLAGELSASAYDHGHDMPPDQMAQAAARALDDILDGSDGQGLLHIGEAIERSLALSERAADMPNGIFGLPLGLIDLDRKIGGLEPDQLVIIAGRPGMGKTAFATSVSYYVAKTDTPVAFFSHEMSASQLTNRLLSQVSGVPLLRIKSGRWDQAERRAMDDAARHLKSLPMFIDDAAGQSPSAIRAKARRFKRKRGLGLMLIDHIQIMRGDARSYQNRTAEVTDISRSLKVCAKELHVPVIALSQLSRAVEARDPPKPQLADLRESGSIEQDADLVAFLFREEYYHKQKEPSPNDPKHSEWEADLFAMRGKAEILLEKGRDIETGKVDVFFDGECLAYRNLAKPLVVQGQAA